MVFTKRKEAAILYIFLFLCVCMPTPEQVMKQVLPSIVPPKKDPCLKEAQGFVQGLNQAIKQKKIRAKAVLGGSFAKNTHLVGDYDVDVFVMFDQSYADNALSGLLGSVLKKYGPERVHGSRDYFQIRNEILFEVIPVRALKKPEDAMNVTDFSPFHVSWVAKNGVKIADQIRLAKKFCKAQRVYGAESYILGFSGHVLDILTIYYGGFLQLLRAVGKWKEKVVVDPKNVYKGRALHVLNTSKTQGPLVVVDPTQPGRNAAAAVSRENFGAFVRAAKQFLKRPSVDFFAEKPVDVVQLKKKGVVLVAKLVPQVGSENVVGAKLMKAKEFLAQCVREFGVKSVVWEWSCGSPAFFYFVLEKDVLPKECVHKGPPLVKTVHVAAFKKKYKKTWVKGDFIFANVLRVHERAQDALMHACGDEYVRERVKSCEVSHA